MSDPKSVTIWSKVNGIDELAELALNLHWSWNHASDDLWKRLDAEMWRSTQNPWGILQTVSKEKIEATLADPQYRQLLDTLHDCHEESYRADAWFQKKHADSPLTIAAYFSMEFMLSEALPIYSGGLGNVAGDQMKAASDHGIPVVGVGLLYGQGYFRQAFDSNGRQQALYPMNDPGQLPIRPLRRSNGEWLRMRIPMPGSQVWVRCWEVSVGRVKLYLLDSNDYANSPAHRGITGELYGGDVEMRLQQEILLGIGGWRLLRELGVRPEVCHLNEGHAAFAVFERARCYMEDHQLQFDLALAVTRAGNLFTTHTAVPAGFDRFPPDLMRKYFTSYAQDELVITMDDLLAMGRQDHTDAFEDFNMAYLAVRGSGQVSGVSKLHGQVSRKIFQVLFPRWPQEEVPVGSVTNGIHVPTWDSKGADALWTEACGGSRWHGEDPQCDSIRKLTDSQIWKLRNEERKVLVGNIRRRYAGQLASEGSDTSLATNIFDESTLTIGFARRFATYKRPNLLLHDPDRLIHLLNASDHPVQLVIAGKAHPQDRPGQELIKQWNDFIQRNDVRLRVVFLSDYDMMLAQELVQGVDLWVNTPRRPWEACGTSGMKVLANGGLNLSERDGWWAEAFMPSVGWAIGDGAEHGDDPEWDAAEAKAVYSILEQEVIPEFYRRDDTGLPSKWLGRIRESMASLTTQFSAGRAIREYVEAHYIPAATSYRSLAEDSNHAGTRLIEWQRNISRYWNDMYFGAVDIKTHDDRHFFELKVFTGGVDSAGMNVQLYANSVIEGSAVIEEMIPHSGIPNSDGTYTYAASVCASRPASDYTPRIIPRHPGALVPLEAAQILWQR
jgi:starch phosphorylase